MIWKEKALTTIQDLCRDGIEACKTPEEAREFMRLYELENPHARDNIGYLAGYYSVAEKHRIFDWFECKHPYFGLTDPTPQEAFELGKKLAEEHLKTKGL